MCKVVFAPKEPDNRTFNEFIIRIRTEDVELYREWPLPPSIMTTDWEAHILHCIKDEIFDAIEMDDIKEWEKDRFKVDYPLNTELKFRVHYSYWDEIDKNDEDDVGLISVMTEDFKNAEDLKIAYSIIDGFYSTYDEYEANHEIVDIYQI